MSVRQHLDLSSRSAARIWGMSDMWGRPSPLCCCPSLGRKSGGDSSSGYCTCCSWLCMCESVCVSVWLWSWKVFYKIIEMKAKWSFILGSCGVGLCTWWSQHQRLIAVSLRIFGVFASSTCLDERFLFLRILTNISEKKEQDWRSATITRREITWHSRALSESGTAPKQVWSQVKICCLPAQLTSMVCDETWTQRHGSKAESRQKCLFSLYCPLQGV